MTNIIMHSMDLYVGDSVMLYLGQMIPKLKSRAGKQGSSDQGQSQSGSGASKRKGKGRRWLYCDFMYCITFKTNKVLPFYKAFFFVKTGDIWCNIVCWDPLWCTTMRSCQEHQTCSQKLNMLSRSSSMSAISCGSFVKLVCSSDYEVHMSIRKVCDIVEGGGGGDWIYREKSMKKNTTCLQSAK